MSLERLRFDVRCHDCGRQGTLEVTGALVHLEGLLRERYLGSWRCDEHQAVVDRKAAEQERLEQQTQAAERERLRAQRRLDAGGLPEPARHRGWEYLDHDGPVVAAARRWAHGDLPGLAVQGPVGAGKTTLAEIATREAVLRNPRKVRFLSVPLLLARLGSNYQSEQRSQALDVLTGTAALVLDDLDKTRSTEYAAEQLFLAIDQRVSHNIPLLVTTNLTLTELAMKFPDPFGEAIASRLAGSCEHYLLDRDDRRIRR